MKKSLVLLLLTVFLTGAIFTQDVLETPKKGFINFKGCFLFPADSDYKATYSDSAFLPEIKAGIFLSKNFSVWGGISFLSQEGETPELKFEAKSTQTFITLGIGYKFDLAENILINITAGISFISYKEEAMQTEITDSASGINIGAELIYNLTKSIFMNIGFNYINGKDSVDDIDFKLGGVCTGIGAGIRF